MTVTKSSRNKTPLVTSGYVKYSIKRAWAVALLIFIALFFCTSVSTMMQLDTVDEYYAGYNINGVTDEQIEAQIESVVQRLFNELIAISAVIAVCAALFAGCFTLSFLHNKVSAGFFHSLPEKRGGHFIAALTASITVYFVPLLLNTLILTLVFMVRGFFYGYVYSLIAQLFFYTLFYFLVFLAITFLAGTLTGSTAMHALLACYIPIIIPVIFLSLTLLLETGVNYLRCDPFDWLVAIGGYMTPIARMILVFDAMSIEETALPVLFLIIDAVLTPLFFYLAYRIYEKRPIERAGTPIIYKAIGEAVKYSVMLPAAILMGMLFDELGGGIFWLVFGSLTGALLSLMLMNTILARSAKAMFTHLKGFGIFCGATLAIYIIFTTGIFGYADYHVPVAGKITITIDGSDEYVLNDEEAKVFRRYMKEINRGIRSGEINRQLSYRDFDSVTEYGEDMIPKQKSIDNELYEFIAKSEEEVRNASVYVNYSGLFDIVLKYRYYNFPYSDFADVIALVASSESYKEKVVADGAALIDVYISTICPSEIIDELGLFDEYKKLDQEFDKNMGSNGYSLRISFNRYYAFDVNAFLESAEYEKLNLDFAEFIRNRSNILTTEPSIGSFTYELDYTGASNYTRGIDIDYTEGYWGKSSLYCSDIKELLSILDTSGIPLDIYIQDIYSGKEFSFSSTDGIFTVFGKLRSALSECTLEDFVDEKVDTISYAVILDNSKGEVIKVENDSMLRELLLASSVIDSSAMISSFATTDGDYTILYVSNNETLWEAFPAYLFVNRIPEFLK